MKISAQPSASALANPLTNFLSKSFHPSISKYLDENLFRNFEIKDGNLNWNDYDLIFPVYDLYEGNI